MSLLRARLATGLLLGALSISLAQIALARAVGVGPVRSLAPVTKHSGCHIHGSLPDRACTPGSRFLYATRSLVCTPGYSRRARGVPYSEKTDVYAEYGLHRHFNGENGEVDHLIPLELGGSNDRANLWPEAAGNPYGSRQKDRLENRLHDEVCSGELMLSRAQRLIAADWVKVYQAMRGRLP